MQWQCVWFYAGWCECKIHTQSWHIETPQAQRKVLHVWKGLKSCDRYLHRSEIQYSQVNHMHIVQPVVYRGNVCCMNGICPAASVPLPRTVPNYQDVNMSSKRHIGCKMCYRGSKQLQNKIKSWRDYHKRCGGDVREEVDRNPTADENSCSKAGKVLTAAPAGRVGSGIVSNHHPSLLEVPKTLL